MKLVSEFIGLQFGHSSDSLLLGLLNSLWEWWSMIRFLPCNMRQIVWYWSKEFLFFVGNIKKILSLITLDAYCVFSLIILYFPLLINFIIPVQVLGTPTREEIKCMNPNYTEFKFPQIKAHPWHKVLCTSLVVSTSIWE